MVLTSSRVIPGSTVDFQITANLEVSPDAYPNSAKVLMDKDHLFDHLKEPTYTEYVVKRPTAQQYEELVHEFWWDAFFAMLDLFSKLAWIVADDLPLEYPSKLEEDMRQYCKWIQNQ